MPGGPSSICPGSGAHRPAVLVMAVPLTIGADWADSQCSASALREVESRQDPLLDEDLADPGTRGLLHGQSALELVVR